MHTAQDLTLYKELGGSVEALAGKLETNTTTGLSGNHADLQRRKEQFGTNFFEEKRLPTYVELLWAGLQDATIIMLLLCAIASLIIEYAFPHGESSSHGNSDDDADDSHRASASKHSAPKWLEPVAISITVALVINVAAVIDYRKERLFRALNKELHASNKKFVIRDGKPTEVTDRDIVVGDVLQFNAHMLASIPADGILISGEDIAIDEASLTGEPLPIKKATTVSEDGKVTPFIMSGTEVKLGRARAQGKHGAPYQNLQLEPKRLAGEKLGLELRSGPAALST